MIALVDCNNFFASCERLFRPDLKNKPVLVLSNNDGCVVARSEEVKALGVPMGVPYFQVSDIVAKHNVQCFSSNFSFYSNMSQRFLEVLRENAPEVEVYSIDEAFLDISELTDSDFELWGEVLSKKVVRNIGLPVSVGIAPTKTLAKLASGHAKRQGKPCYMDITKSTDFEAVLSATKIESVWGVGRRFAPRLRAAGISNAWQLSQVSEPWIKTVMGINGVKTLRELGGTKEFPMETVRLPRKSLMVSRSFGQGIRSFHELEVATATFAAKAAYQLRSHEQVGSISGIFVYFKDQNGDHRYSSRLMHHQIATQDTAEIVAASLSLLTELYDEGVVYKKVGVFMRHLSSESVCQTNLFDKKSPADRMKRSLLMKSIDGINRRFGSDTVQIASIDKCATRWHSQKKYMSPEYTTSWSQLPIVHGYK